jgi:hypothetical protein
VPETTCERRKRKVRATVEKLLESILHEITQPHFFGKRTITINARDGVPEMIELDAKDQYKLA